MRRSMGQGPTQSPAKHGTTPARTAVPKVSAIIAAAFALCFASAAWADPIAIWFSPLTHNIRTEGKGIEYKEHDFPALIKSDAEWKEANSHISKLQIQANVISSYPDLPELVNFVNSHHWKFSLGMGVNYGFGSAQCSVHLEGITPDQDYAHEAVRNVEKWHSAGGRLDYVSLDSPLLFAHYVTSKCHYSIEEIATHVSNTMSHIFKLYPNVKVEDAEGPFRNTNEAWIADMKQWIALFNEKTGHRIDAVSLDLHFKDPRPGNTWEDTTRMAAAAFHSMGVMTGLLIKHETSKEQPISDAEWMELNRQHIRDAAAEHLGIDFMEIVQWHHHVKNNLPETDPAAYTSLVNYAYKTVAASAGK